MDPIRNPYAPGAGQRPPELAGRDRELQQFAVTLERVADGRPERSMVLSGLRGVGMVYLECLGLYLECQGRPSETGDREDCPAGVSARGGALSLLEMGNGV